MARSRSPVSPTQPGPCQALCARGHQDLLSSTPGLDWLEGFSASWHSLHLHAPISPITHNLRLFSAPLLLPPSLLCSCSHPWWTWFEPCPQCMSTSSPTPFWMVPACQNPAISNQEGERRTWARVPPHTFLSFLSPFPYPPAPQELGFASSG